MSLEISCVPLRKTRPAGPRPEGEGVLASGRLPPRAHVLARVHDWAGLPRGPDPLAGWLATRFEEKEARLAAYYAAGGRGFYTEPMQALDPEVGCVARGRAATWHFLVSCARIWPCALSSLSHVPWAFVLFVNKQVVADWHALGGTALGTSRGGFIKDKVCARA